jgi:hypothetical protein
MKKHDMKPGLIKKIVGKEKPELPLDRAFRFKLMLEEFRGKRPTSDENIRRIVGRTQS